MLLDKEISEFSAEMYLELIMTYNNDIHYDELHSFKEEEDLRTLSVLKLKNRLEKSLSVSIAKVEKMLKRELESSDLIRLCHIGIELANANSSDSRRQEKKRKSGNDDSSPSKKISGEPTTTQLKAEIELLKKGINVDVIEQALREVKEYAARSREINVDTLQLKLMHLDEVARRVGHQDRELYSMVLQRFLCHKNHERVGFLVTSLLSSPAETKLFEKEQKFLKIHGNELLSTKQQKEEVETKNLGNENQFQQFATMMQCMQSVLNPRPSTPFMAQRFAQNPRRMPGNGQRKPPSNYTGCFKCGDINHFKIDCPK
ncbi:uncharacterized protein LOC143060233 [Mytilus galloprovincialis]|uniref:uncharacterized protein LOC143060233 n=1 Tax=Mytilus galloprovincialis TaxID=29158 RepID=UPI0039F119E0